jgi:hypothetical protein
LRVEIVRSLLDKTPWGGWRPSQEGLAAPILDELKRFISTLSSACTSSISPTVFNEARIVHNLVAGLQSSRPKVFCIGMYRTGTSSLGLALSWLGYRTTSSFIEVADKPSDYFDLDPTKWIERLKRVEMYLESMDAFADCPWMYVYQELDRRYPGAKFILTVRNSACEVAQSEIAHWTALGLIERYIAETGRQPVPEMFEERYNTHNAQVSEYFRGRESDLLILCLEKEGDRAWAKICDHLGGLAVPTLPFPKVNARLL